MLFEDLQFEPHPIGCGFIAQHTFRNKWGISVVYGCDYFYCGDNTYEVAILFDGSISAASSIADDVLGYQTKDDITKILEYLEQL